MEINGLEKEKTTAKFPSPFRAVLIYLLVFGLVAVHETNRIVTWAEEFSLGLSSPETALAACQKVRRLADQVGLTALVEAEAGFLDWFDFFSEIGVVEDRALARAVLAFGGGWQTVDSAERLGKAGLILAARKPDDGQKPPLEGSENLEESENPNLAGDRPAAGAALIPPAPLEGKPEPGAEGSEGRTAPPIEPLEDKTPPPAGPGGGFQAGSQKLRPQTILVAGDSMILEGFGVALERRLKKFPGLKVIRKGKYSSGLTRPDYFDWMAYLKEILDSYNPDLMIVSLGANDPQDILDENRKRFIVATPGWNEIYLSRARDFLKIAEQKNVKVFWIGLPIMGRQKYGPRIENINSLQQEACRACPTCIFIDTWFVLADQNNQYTTFIKTPAGRHIRIRAKDRIHLTEAGGEIMVDHFLKEALKVIDLPQPAAAREDGSGG